jgi:CRP/FNR family transcriptional regulator
MLLLGTMLAERRLAVFLLDLADRYRERGYSSCEYVLRMTREEIGSYLGLKLETVSRLFSKFQRDGLLQVQGRTIKLLDRISLRRLTETRTDRRGFA